MDNRSPEGAEGALIDLDGTLADFEGRLREHLVAMASPGEPEITESDLRDTPSWLSKRLHFIKRYPGFWRGLDRIEDGFKVLELILEAGFSTSVLTKGPSTNYGAWTEKVQWCAEHVPNLPVTVGHEKGLVYGRLLFDDFPDYALRWLEHRPRGVVLMLDSPINRGFEHPQVVRVMRPFTEEVAQVVREALARAKRR